MGTAPAIAVRASPGRSAADPVRVVIVDDSPTVRAVLTRLIDGEADLKVAAAQDSAESALARLVRWTPDVILLDLDMPGMGGLHAIPRMIELAAPARILVVSSLAVRGAEHTLQALALGAADTLAKPRPGEFDDEYRATLLRKIRLLGRVAKRARLNALPPTHRPYECMRENGPASWLSALRPGASMRSASCCVPCPARSSCRSSSPSTCLARSWSRSCASCRPLPAAPPRSRSKAWRSGRGRSSWRRVTRT